MLYSANRSIMSEKSQTACALALAGGLFSFDQTHCCVDNVVLASRHRRLPFAMNVMLGSRTLRVARFVDVTVLPSSD